MSNPVLKSVHVQGFKAIEDAFVELTDTTLMVGPNNSGKSSVLQAVHFAARCMAQANEANKQGTISLREIEYIPTSLYKQLGHHGAWGNTAGSPESRVEFTFDVEKEGEDGSTVLAASTASIILKSARNEGISANPRIPPDLQSIFRSSDNVFSAYIPGIAGIPLSEQFISRRNVFRKAASGDSNVVLRNSLLIIKEEDKFDSLVTEVKNIYPDVELYVNFDQRNDYDIDASVAFTGTSNEKKPLELAGTGFLQVLQIMSYLVLFNPSVILIDEPESHLHPPLQTRLVATLQRRVASFNTKALVTTHSPFVARGLKEDAKTIWLRSGSVLASSMSQTIRDALGWGALDRQILLCTEDSNRKHLNAILAQDAALSDRVCVVPLKGADRADTPAVIHNIHNSLGGHHKVVVHRDRDFMTSSEIDTWVQRYDDTPFHPWVTDGSDIEACFLQVDNLAGVLLCSEDDVLRIYSDILDEMHEELHKRFLSKRSEINRKMYAEKGGSPASDQLWDEWEFREKVTGKEAMSRVRAKLEGTDLDRAKVGKIADGVPVASTLLEILRSL